MCGVSSTFGISRSAGGTTGSPSITSSAAPAMAPPCSAAINASVSTTEPRPTLTRTPCGPSAASSAAPTRCRVAGPPGVTTISTSDISASASGDSA